MEMSRMIMELFLLLLLLVSECHPQLWRCPLLTTNSESVKVKVVQGFANNRITETINGQSCSVINLYTETMHFRISFSDPARATCELKASSFRLTNISDVDLNYMLYMSDDDTLLYGCQEMHMVLYVEFFCQCRTPDMEKKMKTMESAFENRKLYEQEKILQFPACDVRFMEKHYWYIICGVALFAFILCMVTVH